VAERLRELSARVALAGEPHRASAYRRAADTLDELDRPIAEIREREGRAGLEALPGIGAHIAAKIDELFETGRIGALERLRREVPVDVTGLLAIEGLGPKTLRRLWEELGVKTVDDLEAALANGRVRTLPGFGERREQRLRQSLLALRRGGRRFPHAEAMPIARRICEALARVGGVERC